MLQQSPCPSGTSPHRLVLTILANLISSANFLRKDKIATPWTRGLRGWFLAVRCYPRPSIQMIHLLLWLSGSDPSASLPTTCQLILEACHSQFDCHPWSNSFGKVKIQDINAFPQVVPLLNFIHAFNEICLTRPSFLETMLGVYSLNDVSCSLTTRSISLQMLLVRLIGG